jgi:hypothetical protein
VRGVRNGSRFAGMQDQVRGEMMQLVGIDQPGCGRRCKPQPGGVMGAWNEGSAFRPLRMMA